MGNTAGMVVSEILMAGLKSVPFVGKAVEVVDAIRVRHALHTSADMHAELDRRVTSFERGMRDLVRREIEEVVSKLRLPDLAGPELTEQINRLREITAPAANVAVAATTGQAHKSAGIQKPRQPPNGTPC